MSTFWLMLWVTCGCIAYLTVFWWHCECCWHARCAAEKARLSKKLTRDELRMALNADYLHRLTFGLIGERIP